MSASHSLVIYRGARFVESLDRSQCSLFPECLDDWIDENNPVRVIDVFVDALNLAELGFDGVEAAGTRSEYEHVPEAGQRRLDENPKAMCQRRGTVEHPFGTIMARMGATHFLMKSLSRVASEMGCTWSPIISRA